MPGVAVRKGSSRRQNVLLIDTHLLPILCLLVLNRLLLAVGSRLLLWRGHAAKLRQATVPTASPLLEILVNICLEARSDAKKSEKRELVGWKTGAIWSASQAHDILFTSCNTNLHAHKKQCSTGEDAATP